MTTPELNDRSGGSAEVLIPMFNDLRITSWAENKLSEYNMLPKANSQERKKVKSLIAQIAGGLLQNPQDIEIAVDVWKNTEGQTDLEFYELVKKESGALIKENWKSIASEQLVHLIKIYANNDLIPDFAQELLSSYFKGPKTRRQRIDTYYNFTSLTLDLVEDNKAFNEAIKIGLHDKDILPKDPYLIEQSIYMSLPYGEEEKVLQQLLIAKYMILRLSFMGSGELEEARRREKAFTSTNKKLKIMWEREQRTVKKKMGGRELKRLNDTMNAFNDSLVEKKGNEKSWVYALFSDPTDPLNQKFKRVFPQIAVSK